MLKPHFSFFPKPTANAKGHQNTSGKLCRGCAGTDSARGTPAYSGGKWLWSLASPLPKSYPELQYSYFPKTLAKRNFLEEVKERFPSLAGAKQNTNSVFSAVEGFQLEPKLRTTHLPLLFLALGSLPKAKLVVSRSCLSSQDIAFPACWLLVFSFFWTWVMLVLQICKRPWVPLNQTLYSSNLRSPLSKSTYYSVYKDWKRRFPPAYFRQYNCFLEKH